MENPMDENAVDELKMAIAHLLRRMRAAAPSEQHELSWTQKAVIVRLEREGPMTAADLARAEGVKPQSMGTAIQQLQEMGMVEKKPRKDDGRQVDIRVTAKATALRKKTKELSRSWLSEAISKLSKQERATLFAAGTIINKMVNL